jgi:hypothetical protein
MFTLPGSRDPPAVPIDVVADEVIDAERVCS